MTLDIEAILAEATPQEVTVPICLRGDLRRRWEELDRELKTASREAASLGDIAPATVIAKQMADLEQQIADATVPFLLHPLHPLAWAAFAGTRPTKGKDQPDEEWDQIWHAWICEMVSLTCVDPKMTPEQVDRLVAKLSNRQWTDLADTAWGVNAERERVPFSVAASALISLDGEKSRRPEPQGSLSPGSSDVNRAGSPPTSTTTPAG